MTGKSIFDEVEASEATSSITDMLIVKFGALECRGESLSSDVVLKLNRCELQK